MNAYIPLKKVVKWSKMVTGNNGDVSLTLFAEPKPFNITQPRPRAVPVPEPVSILSFDHISLTYKSP